MSHARTRTCQGESHPPLRELIFARLRLATSLGPSGLIMGQGYTDCLELVMPFDWAWLGERRTFKDNKGKPSNASSLASRAWKILLAVVGWAGEGLDNTSVNLSG